VVNPRTSCQLSGVMCGVLLFVGYDDQLLRSPVCPHEKAKVARLFGRCARNRRSSQYWQFVTWILGYRVRTIDSNRCYEPEETYLSEIPKWETAL